MEKAMVRFDEKSDLQKKRIVQAIVPEVVVNSEEEVTLMVNPDPFDRHTVGGNEFALRREWRRTGPGFRTVFPPAGTTH